MSHNNIEIKAKCADTAAIRRILQDLGADFRGTDSQTDTYFNVSTGRLKLRQGNIENSLIFYEREDSAGPKKASVSLYQITESPDQLRQTLTAALGVKITVSKTREIYFIDNVKFHIDSLESLGNFVEIEAIDTAGSLSLEYLQKQCEHYMELFGISPQDLLTNSYSDMLMQ